MEMKKLYFLLVVILIGVVLSVGYFALFYNPYKFSGSGPIKILHINSYNYGFELVDENLVGFEEFLKDKDIDFEIKKFEMNLLQDISEENKVAKVAEARDIIESWEPDLIYATDDEVQKLLIKPYYYDSKIPIVFSGINDDYEDYDYEDSKNIVGIYERLLFVDLIESLEIIYPDVKKIAALTDTLPQWEKVSRRFQEQSKEFPNIEFVGWEKIVTFDEYKQKMLDYQKDVDVIMLFGLTYLEKEDGSYAQLNEIYRWNSENIVIPDISFWDFASRGGILLSVEVSPYEQGRRAGEIAYRILITGQNPRDFEIDHTTIGTRHINMKKANLIGIERDLIPGVFLVNSEVYEYFSWENETIE